jgi:hypothetical protein
MMKHLKWAGRFYYIGRATGVTSAKQSGDGCALRFIIFIIIIIIITDSSETSRRVALCYVNSNTLLKIVACRDVRRVERYFSTKKASDNGRFIVISYDDTSRRI